MNSFFKAFYSEVLKFSYMKATKIVLAIVLVLQTGLAYIAAKQILLVGLNATPETNHNLLEAIPSIEYLGFDVTLLGILPMIVLGALYGALDYKFHSMRTSLLSINKKTNLFVSKFITIAITSWLISILSILLTIIATHIVLGDKGLDVFNLPMIVWSFIFRDAFAWTALTVLSFLIGFLCRSAIIPLLFLIPQVYNLGDLLAEHFYLARFLPFALGKGLIASSEQTLTTSPFSNITFLSLWIFLFGCLAYVRFVKSDLGEVY